MSHISYILKHNFDPKHRQAMLNSLWSLNALLFRLGLKTAGTMDKVYNDVFQEHLIRTSGSRVTTK